MVTPREPLGGPRPPATQVDRPTSAGWYGVVFGLFGTAIAIALTGFNQSNETIEGMQRRLMPGTVEIALAAGQTTLYFEDRSIFEGQRVDVDKPVDVRCVMRDQNGKPAPMTKPTANASYSIPNYRGHNVLDVQIPTPGTYTLSCEGTQNYVLALGAGIGAWIVVAIVGGLVPGLAGLAIAVLVTVKRYRWRRRQRAGLVAPT